MTALSPDNRTRVIGADRLIYRLSRHWIWVFTLTYGVFVLLPFLAPPLMKLGWEGPARLVYGIFSFLCHQLPQRSFFLFGSKGMYSLAEIQGAFQSTNNPLLLRQFIGNPEMGWKVAWSDRMVSMYTSVLLFGWAWWLIRKRLKSFPAWLFILLLIPMAVDGTTHMISDFSGLGQGFRDTNIWLTNLTAYRFSPTFYTGDAIGSFNSWMRLLTGILFGIGVVGFGFPYLQAFFAQTARLLEAKFNQAGIRL